MNWMMRDDAVDVGTRVEPFEEADHEAEPADYRDQPVSYDCPTCPDCGGADHRWHVCPDE